MSVYADLTTEFDYKDLVTSNNLDALGENDNYLNTLIAARANYRRPVLQWVSISLVDVEANTDTANQTKIVFPDNTVRTVTENTGSTTKYRRFDITAAANFTTGTEDSGLRSGISEAANTWYAIYAVKSSINANNFVIAGDTTLPLRSAFATLNARYGTNGWVYLGMIRNGDKNGAGTAESDLLDFVQVGNMTLFRNLLGSAGFLAGSMGPGIIMQSNSVGAANATYTYVAGNGAQQIPDHVTIVQWDLCMNAVVGVSDAKLLDASINRVYFWDTLNTNGSSAIDMRFRQWIPAVEGVRVTYTGVNAQTIFLLTGWVDPALGVGVSPLL